MPCCGATAAGLAHILRTHLRHKRAEVEAARAFAETEEPQAVFARQSASLVIRMTAAIIWRREPNGSRMSRDAAIARAADYFDSGGFQGPTSPAGVAIPTESQKSRARGRARALCRIRDEAGARGTRLRLAGCCATPKARGPFLVGERHEGAGLPTILAYGHGDVIRGLEAGWKPGLSPWRLVETDGRYYGRGVADNKGQHTINIAALGAVLAVRGRLGFNIKWLIEMGEETGSSGLREVCEENRELLRGPTC